MIEFHCPQCGEPTETLYEGYCQECCNENQQALDEYNAAFDNWNRLTDQQRSQRIKDAIRNA